MFFPMLNPQIPAPDGQADFGILDCRRAVEEHARYDTIRLEVYAGRKANAGRIAFRRASRAVAMRFASIGYFNQIYHLDLEALPHLSKLEDFVREGGWHPKVCVAPDTDRLAVEGRLESEGFVPHHTVVRLGLRLSPRPSIALEAPEELSVNPVNPDGFEEFFQTYLDAFGADGAPEKRADAVSNMVRLRNCPSLRFHLARWNGQAVGVGVMHCEGEQASLCGGAIKEPFRNMGVHAALLAVRIEQARRLGATWVSAWADKGGSG